MKNPWNAVAEEVGLEGGAEAEKKFIKWRKKQSRYKRDVKKKEVSGTSSAAVQKAKMKREGVNYLSWLDIYTQPRKSKKSIEGELAVSQIASQVKENGGEFSDEQTDDSYQSTEDISQVNAHADGNEFEPSFLIESTPKPNNAKEKEKKNLKLTEKGNHQESTETEEMNILQSIGNAYRVAEQKDAYDVFGYYIATKMRRLTSSVDQETIEIMEHEITNVIEENHRMFRARSSQAAAMYAYNPAASYRSQIPPPPQLPFHTGQNFTEKLHQLDWY